MKEEKGEDRRGGKEDNGKGHIKEAEGKKMERKERKEEAWKKGRKGVEKKKKRYEKMGNGERIEASVYVRKKIG